MAVLLQVAVPPIRTSRVKTVQLVSISDEATPALLLRLVSRSVLAIALIRRSELELPRNKQIGTSARGEALEGLCPTHGW